MKIRNYTKSWLLAVLLLSGPVLALDIQIASWDDINSFQDPNTCGDFNENDPEFYNLWYDAYCTDLMKQATTANEPNLVYEGTGSVWIDFNDFDSNDLTTGDWNPIPSIFFDPPLDLNSIDERALTFWYYKKRPWKDPEGLGLLFQFLLYGRHTSDPNGDDPNTYIPTTLRFAPPVHNGGWQKVVAPIDWFVPDIANVTMYDKITRIDFWCSTWPVAGDQQLAFDDLRLTDDRCPSLLATEAVVKQAWRANITVDGNASDWAGLGSDTISMDLQSLPTPEDNGNLNVDYRLAWDPNFLYILVEEQTGDELSTEPGSYGMAKLAWDLWDMLSLFFDFSDFGTQNNLVDLYLSLYFGPGDVWIAFINGAAGIDPDVPAALANGLIVTSGTRPNRIIEAGIRWQDLEDNLSPGHKPYDCETNVSSLLNAVGPGFTFGCDPRLGDAETLLLEYWDPNAGAAWMTGENEPNLWPNGLDVNSIDIRLCGSAADLDDDCYVTFLDYALFAAEWLAADCSALNDWCNGADMEPVGSPDGDVDNKDLKEFVSHWLE